MKPRKAKAVKTEKPKNGLRAFHVKKAGAGLHQTQKGRTRKGKFRRDKKWIGE